MATEASIAEWTRLLGFLGKLQRVLAGGLCDRHRAIEIEAERLEQGPQPLLDRVGQRPSAIERAAPGPTTDGLFRDRVLPEPPERNQRGGHVGSDPEACQVAPSLARASMSASL